MRFLWRNVPLPEPFIRALVLGGLLQLIFPVAIFPASHAWVVLGVVLILAGFALAAWAVTIAGEMDVERPTSLLTSGPYAFSRNPMYLSWTIAAVGLAVLFNALWLLVTALLAWIYLNFVTIPGEERALREKFTSEYDAYRQSVRRWF